MSSYPKWLYHPHKDALVVQDEAAHKALGLGWYESPALFPKTADPLPAQLPASLPKKVK